MQPGATVAILLAAGSSRRMGGVDKLWADLGGRPLLAWPLERLTSLEEVDGVVVVAPGERHAGIATLAAGLRTPVRCVEGGASRRHSVAAGIGEAPEAAWYLVHDAARPLASAELARRVLAAAHEHSASIDARIPRGASGDARIPRGASGDARIPRGASGDARIPRGASGDARIPRGASGDARIPRGASGDARIPRGAAVPGLPPTDTIKVVEPDGRVRETLDRASLRAIQTPQAFAAPLLRRAHREVEGDASDDAVLVERLGESVWVVEGEPEALKVTTAEDLARARRLAAGQGRGED